VTRAVGAPIDMAAGLIDGIRDDAWGLLPGQTFGMAWSDFTVGLCRNKAFDCLLLKRRPTQWASELKLYHSGIRCGLGRSRPGCLCCKHQLQSRTAQQFDKLRVRPTSVAHVFDLRDRDPPARKVVLMWTASRLGQLRGYKPERGGQLRPYAIAVA